MINIGICDDEEGYREELRKKVEEFFKATSIEGRCVVFESAKQVMEYKGERLLLLFLDIEMPGMSGVELLRELEQSILIWRIVFVTSHEESKIDTVSIRTLGFEKKPIPYVNLDKYIRIALKESCNSAKILMQIGGEECAIEAEDIWFVEAEGNYSSLKIGKEKVLGDESLKKVEKKLEINNFIRCHKSFLVNIVKIHKVNVNSIFLDNGDIIPLGRTYKKKIDDERKRFLLKLAMGRI